MRSERVERSIREIALGGAQFGLDYGVTNSSGRLSGTLAAEVLAKAYAGGVTLVDTASAYGESEGELGRYFDEHPREHWRVITKVPPIRASRITSSEVEAVGVAFSRSLVRLRRPHVDALLVHDARNLLEPGGERLVGWLMEQKTSGKAKQIGASVYDASEVERLMRTADLDVVQLPASVADQRLVRDGTVEALARNGVEIHVRSIFLQGLLLETPARVDQLLPGRGAWIARFRAIASEVGVTPLQACLSFFMAVPWFRVAVLGVGRSSELRDILLAWRGARPLDWGDVAADDSSFFDPRQWRLP